MRPYSVYGFDRHSPQLHTPLPPLYKATTLSVRSMTQHVSNHQWEKSWMLNQVQPIHYLKLSSQHASWRLTARLLLQRRSCQSTGAVGNAHPGGRSSEAMSKCNFILLNNWKLSTISAASLQFTFPPTVSEKKSTGSEIHWKEMLYNGCGYDYGQYQVVSDTAYCYACGCWQTCKKKLQSF